MQRRKRLLIAGSLLLLLIFAIFIIGRVFSSGDDTPADETPIQKVTNSAESATDVVRITNATDYETWIQYKDLEPVEKWLYRSVTRYVNNPRSSYASVIRDGSLQTTYENSIPEVTYIVDIPDIRQSYVISQSGSDGSDYSILHVSCPTKEQLKFGDFGCVDEEQ